MTLKNCSKGYHPVAGFFTATLKRQTGITLLFAAFLLLICPGILLPELFDMPKNGYNLISEVDFRAALIAMLSLVLGAILLCYNHTQLFNKTSADLYYSLPLKRDALLLTRFGASAVGTVFAFTVSFLCLAIINFLPNVIGIALSDLLLLYVLCVLVILLCLSMILIFVVNAGSVFNFIFSTAVVCIGIPMVCFIATLWYEAAAEGVVTNSSEWIVITSPIAYGFRMIAGAFGDLLSVKYGKLYSEYYTAPSSNMVLQISVFCILIPVLVTLLFVGIALFMNRRRKTERAGGSFAFSATHFLIVALAACFGGYAIGEAFMTSLDIYDGSFWVAFVFGAVLAGAVAGVIISKGFRKFWRWPICAAAATTLMLAVFLVADGMGTAAALKVPQAGEIKSVTITEYYDEISYTVTKDFDTVIALHRQLIEAGNNDSISNSAKYYFFELETVEADKLTGNEERYYALDRLLPNKVDLTYELEDGTNLHREYFLNDFEGMLLYLKLMQTDEVAASWANRLREEKDLTQVILDISVGNSDIVGGTAVLSVEETCRLLEAYGRDIQRMEVDLSYESYGYCTVQLYRRNRDYFETIRVFAEFEETNALLEEIFQKDWRD